MIYTAHLACVLMLEVDYGIEDETTRYHQIHVQRMAPCSDWEIPIVLWGILIVFASSLHQERGSKYGQRSRQGLFMYPKCLTSGRR